MEKTKKKYLDEYDKRNQYYKSNYSTYSNSNNYISNNSNYNKYSNTYSQYQYKYNDDYNNSNYHYDYNNNVSTNNTKIIKTTNKAKQLSSIKINEDYQVFPFSYLYVDGLNYIRDFFDSKDFWNLEYAEKEISFFVKKIREANLEPVIFVDGIRVTHETKKKWFSRREKETTKAERVVCPFSSIFLFEIFTKLKVEFKYSCDEDNDDTLASYANYNYYLKSQGYILSRDRDFYRYINYQYIVYTDFIYKSNINKHVSRYYKSCSHNNYRIHFENCYANQIRKDGVSLRKILFPLPNTTKEWSKTTLEPDFENNSGYFQSKGKNYLFLKSSPTHLTKYLGNPIIHISSLRLTVFYLLGFGTDCVIKEIVPSWDEKYNVFCWYENITSPLNCPKMIELLKDPEKAFDHFYSKDHLEELKNKAINKGVSKKEWFNYLFSIRSAIYGLYVMVTPGTTLLNLMTKKDYTKNETYETKTKKKIETGIEIISIDKNKGLKVIMKELSDLTITNKKENVKELENNCLLKNTVVIST